jgi:hypothetical protein
MTTTSFPVDRITFESTGHQPAVTLVIHVRGDGFHVDVVTTAADPADTALAATESPLAAYTLSGTPPPALVRRDLVGHRTQARRPPEPDSEVMMGAARWGRRLVVGGLAATVIVVAAAALLAPGSHSAVVASPATTAAPLSDGCRRLIDIGAGALGTDRDNYLRVVVANASQIEPLSQVVHDQLSEARALHARQLEDNIDSSRGPELNGGLEASTAAIQQADATPCAKTLSPLGELPHSADAAEQWVSSLTSTNS